MQQAAALWSGDLVIPQGATEGSSWPRSWMLAEQEPPRPPAEWPTGWTARLQVRQRRDADVVLASLSSVDGTLLLDTAVDRVGTAQVTFARVTTAVPAAVTSAWTWQSGVYDLELAGPNGRVIRLAQGAVVLDREVTR